MTADEVDPAVWKACAGTAPPVPAVGSRAYYFPHGHAEQAASLPDVLGAIPSMVLCCVTAVRLLADHDTDEVFARIRLDPCFHLLFSQAPKECLPSSQEEDGVFLSFPKILTASDANNGGGFSVPRFCAETILPPLDYEKRPPSQTIYVRDLHGKSWSFRHIYRGTPRRHLLTTGWSTFVNEKKLVTGDSVVFMKNLSGQLLVGIRRTSQSRGTTEYSPYHPKATFWKIEKHTVEKVLPRNARVEVQASSVAEITRLAGKGMPFEVLYYPKSGYPNFVVAAEAVDPSMKLHWSIGSRVRMSVESEDSARMTWFHGTVSKVAQGSPWRMLQVIWDEPEVFKNARNVSPWQVELVCVSSQIDTPFHPMKKLKGTKSSEFFHHQCIGMSSFQMTGLDSRNLKLFNYHLSPPSIQGARQDAVNALNIRDCINQSNKLLLNGLSSQKKDLFTDLGTNISTQSGVSCTPSENSTQTSDEKISELENSTVKSSTQSFRLFGKVIHLGQPNNGDTVDEHQLWAI